MSTSAIELREGLVAALVASGVVRTPAVREALSAVPRELFVPQLAAVRGLKAIYADEPLVIQERDGVPTSASSQPSIMAEMLEAIEVRPGHRVLEVGLGTGYNAALLSHLVGRTGAVTSLDIDPTLVADAAHALDTGGYRVTTRTADGRRGWPAGAPYDRIIVAASAAELPRAWWEQLAPTGLLIVPLRVGALQIIAVLRSTETGFRSVRLVRGGFMALRESTPDGEVTATDVYPTIGIRVTVAGQPSVDISAYGPGLATLGAAGRRYLIAHLLEPPSATSIEPVPAWPVIWHTAMTADPCRQIGVYSGVGVRFGLVDAASGACSLLVATFGDANWATSCIESFGPHSPTEAELLSCIDAWTHVGSPSFDQLTIEVDYAQGSAGAQAVHTIRSHHHVISLGWATA